MLLHHEQVISNNGLSWVVSAASLKDSWVHLVTWSFQRSGGRPFGWRWRGGNNVDGFCCVRQYSMCRRHPGAVCELLSLVGVVRCGWEFRCSWRSHTSGHPQCSGWCLCWRHQDVLLSFSECPWGCTVGLGDARNYEGVIELLTDETLLR